MSTEIVATSDNIKNITSMLTKLETVKDDSSKLREISLDNTGWEGMDASSFNTALNNFTQKLDKTTDDIADALNVYLKKQEEQLENGDEAAKTAANLIENLIEAGQEKIRQLQEKKRQQEKKKEEVSKEQEKKKEEKKRQEQEKQKLSQDRISRDDLSNQLNDSNISRERTKEILKEFSGYSLSDQEADNIIIQYGDNGYDSAEVYNIFEQIKPRS